MLPRDFLLPSCLPYRISTVVAVKKYASCASHHHRTVPSFGGKQGLVGRDTARHDTACQEEEHQYNKYTSHKLLYIYIYVYISERKERSINLLFNRTVPVLLYTTRRPCFHPPTSKNSLVVCLFCNTIPYRTLHCTVTYLPNSRCGGKNDLAQHNRVIL